MEQQFYGKSDNFAAVPKKAINVAEAYNLEDSSPITSIFVTKDLKKINESQDKNKEIFASPERPELTIADLEPSSTSSTDRNLLTLAKSSRASDTFALSKTTDGSLLKSKLSVRFSDTDQSGQINLIEEKKLGKNFDLAENTYDNLKQKEIKIQEIAKPHCPTCRCALEKKEIIYENEKASLGVSERDLKYLSSLGSSSLLKSNYPAHESPPFQKIHRPYTSPIKIDSQKTPRIYISPIYNPATSPSHIFRERLNRRILSFEKNSPSGYNLYRKTY